MLVVGCVAVVAGCGYWVVDSCGDREVMEGFCVLGVAAGWHSVPEAPFSGTGQVRCPENSLVMHGAQFIKRRSVQGWASCHPREQGLPPGNMSGETRPGNTAEKHGLNTWDMEGEARLTPENMAKKTKFASLAISTTRR